MPLPLTRAGVLLDPTCLLSGVGLAAKPSKSLLPVRWPTPYFPNSYRYKPGSKWSPSMIMDFPSLTVCSIRIDKHERCCVQCHDA